MITVEGRPVALLSPYSKRRWVPKADLVKLLRANKPGPHFFEDVAELGAL